MNKDETKTEVLEHNPSAFAAAIPASDARHDCWVQTGMSLRDYFAGQALLGMVCADFMDRPIASNPAQRANQSYQYADAMLLERNKPI